MQILIDLVLLGVILALLALAAEIFTNAVEWLGSRLNLSTGAVGSVLAAVGTALPETLIPIVAIVLSLLGTEESHQAAEHIGVGAILGAPFMLATLGVFMVGSVFFLYRSLGRTKPFHVDISVAEKDFRFFLITYPLGVIAGLASWYFPKVLSHPQLVTASLHTIKVVLAVLLVVAYVVYVRRIVRTGRLHGEGEELRQLHLVTLADFLFPSLVRLRNAFLDRGVPRRRFIILQLAFALFLILAGAYLIVGVITDLSYQLGISPLVLSLLIIPVATELPEKLNSVVWVREGKDTLALGNMSGAMVFQSTIPVAIGMLFTEWTFDPRSFETVSVMLALLGGLLVYLNIRKNRDVDPRLLMIGGLLYLVYLAIVILNPLGVSTARPKG